MYNFFISGKIRSVAAVFLIIFFTRFISFEPSKGQDFTLNQILSVPYSYNLVSDPYEDRIAWVENRKGIRNIWIAFTPDFKPVQITDYFEDDGQVINQLHFSPDGKFLVFVRGGSPNKQGEIPNPTSDPKGAEQAIYKIYLEGGSAEKLAIGNDPVISTDGQLLVFHMDNQLYQIPLKPDEDVEISPKLFFHARGYNRSISFSKDGNRVLFTSYRGDHSFIGIYDVNEEKINWIAPGIDRDMFPVWSPDEKQIAYIRFPGTQKGELNNLTAGIPFSIHITDTETGASNMIWKSPGKDGGFAQTYPAHPLRWTKNNHLIFYSEHQGWMHIYFISPEGENLTDLTPGNCEAEHSTVTSDGQFLYFSSNSADMDRRHIWKVSTNGGQPQQLTLGEGIETDPVVLANDQLLAYRSGTFNRPQGISIIKTNGKGNKNLFSPLPEGFQANNLVKPQPVKFISSDGLEIRAQLFLPKAAYPGDKRPAVIFMHGGPIRQMLLGWHYRGYYANTYAMNQFLANQGYVVLSVNYRCGIGYGKDFRQAENQGPRGASEYKDIIAAGKYLCTRPEINPNKIGLYGGSYGGYLTALGLARNSDLFAAGVDLHGVHDWSWRATDFSPGGGWGLTPNLFDKAYLSSPVADLSFWSSPVLFIHGDDDRNVMFSQTTDLVQRLRKRDVHTEVLIFPDEVHSFLRHESWLRAFRATADFFNRFLK